MAKTLPSVSGINTGGSKEIITQHTDVPNKFTIKLNPVGIEIQPGQRLRLDVSSSDFPNFDRNHNTGKDFWSDTELKIAKQTVFHNSEMPSRLLMPLS